jgi:hypothetical protein
LFKFEPCQKIVIRGRLSRKFEFRFVVEENMNYSRRDFIKFGGFALGMLPTLATTGFGSGNSKFALYNIESVEKLLGSAFTIYTTEFAVESKLMEVKVADSKTSTSGNCFSMVFELQSNSLEQGTYQMYHPEIGMFNLFLVPGISKAGVPLMIAVVNRI